MLGDAMRAMNEIGNRIRKGPPPMIGRTRVGGFVVSTVDTGDEGPETAIIDMNGAHPVARYDTPAKAKAGHARWIKRLKAGDRTFTKLGYGDLAADAQITVEPMSEADAKRVAAP